MARRPTSQKIRLLINEDVVPRRSCNSLWMGTEEYSSIMPMWRKFQSSARTALCQRRIHLYETKEIRDTFANLMKDVCFDVELEPKFQPLEEFFDNKITTTEDEARLDIKENGLWETSINRTFFDVKIFNPQAKSCPRTIKEAYKLLKLKND